MDAKKETRHFVRDRCNFNKKKRIKYMPTWHPAAL